MNSLGSHVFQNAGQQLVTIAQSRNLWMALLFIALFSFAPGFSTPLFYKQTDELHFSKQSIGNLGVFSVFCAILATIVYGKFIKRIQIRTMLLAGIATAAVGTLFYLFYSTWTHAVLIESEYGFFFRPCRGRSSRPRGASYASGVRRSWVLTHYFDSQRSLFRCRHPGSYLADHNWPFANLVYLNAGTTAIVLLLLPLLPAALMRSKDEAENTIVSDGGSILGN
jgi:hypothetical protein